MSTLLYVNDDYNNNIMSPVKEFSQYEYIGI